MSEHGNNGNTYTSSGAVVAAAIEDARARAARILYVAGLVRVMAQSVAQYVSARLSWWKARAHHARSRLAVQAPDCSGTCAGSTTTSSTLW